MRRTRTLVATATLVLATCGATAAAQTQGSPTAASRTALGPAAVSKGFYTLRKVGTLDGALDLVERDARDPFFYVVSQKGVIQRWSRNGARRVTVLDLRKATEGEGERGVLGLDFRLSNKRWEAFVSYTNLDGDSVVARYRVRDNGTFVGGPSSPGTTIITVEQPYSNHNGGDIEIGPDNMLYLALGDGGAANDPERRSLDTKSLLGKILRINPTANGYTVPRDNPFVSVSGARREIWSLGLRNPWRITFDDSGNLWVADVGQNKWEEVSLARANGTVPGGRGTNFGWSAWEGTHRFNKDVSAPGSLKPVHEYSHDDGRCSISGGAVGTTRTTPGRDGWYFFGDYCAGRVWAIFVTNGRTQAKDTVARGLEAITAVRSTSTGMYVLSNGGRVSRIVTAGRP